jgi:hypothetical protein
VKPRCAVRTPLCVAPTDGSKPNEQATIAEVGDLVGLEAQILE